MSRNHESADGAEGVRQQLVPEVSHDRPSPRSDVAKEPQELVLDVGEATEFLDADGGAKLTVDLLQEREFEVERADILETLRNVFDSMATNGKITMDQLPFVLVGADVQATAKEIEEAIEEHIPDADDPDASLDFEQVEALYQQLARTVLDLVPTTALDIEPAAKRSPWRRAWDWAKARYRQRKTQATAYEKHMKPTMRLLLLILCTSCLMCTAVVVFAVIFIWDNSTATVVDHLVRDVELVRDGLNLFGYTHQFDTYNVNEARFAALTAVILEDLGYQGTRTTMMKNLGLQETTMGGLLDGCWFAHDSTNTVSSTAVLVKSWVEQLLNVRPEDAVVAMLNTLSPRMPDGHEILLGKWANGSQTEVAILNDLRYASQCDQGVCGTDKSWLAPMILGIEGQVGSLFANDYRPMPVVAAYSFIQGTGIGLVYKVDTATMQEDFLDPITTVVDELNLKTTQSASAAAAASAAGQGVASQEVVLAKTTAGKTQVLTALRNCDAKCMQAANIEGSVLTLALEGNTGVNETTDFDGEPIFSAYGPLPYSGMGLVIKMAIQELVDNLYVSLGESLDVVNTQLLDTQEVQLAARVGNSTASTSSDLAVYTAYKFPTSCQGPCGSLPNTSVYMWNAIDACASGVMSAMDYRGVMVTAGYACIPSMKAAIVMKVDQSQMIAEGVTMAGTIAMAQNDVRYKAKSTEVMVAKLKPGVVVPRSVADIDQVTTLKHGAQCGPGGCQEITSQMLLALEGETGSLEGPDYRGVSCIGAYTYTEGLNLGVVIKVDTVEAEAPSLLLTLELCACTISAVVLSMLTLAFLANVLLQSMDRTWEEGKRAIEREKQQFRTVIEAMYPSQVAKRMLAGEAQIVYNVGSATVFFSDIYEFTATSNVVTPEQLIQFMGYTFGTMDHIADHYHVYKVKTIGDAYLAVAGLPGSDTVSGHAALDMLLFASACAQAFSSRFVHPEEGAILSAVAKSVLSRKKKLDAAAAAAEMKGHVDRAAPGAGGATEAEDNVPHVHCIMRYGVAAGPITAGVLQGKTPLFDIWGKTVNLASRMESTGQPGRIQVSEAVYQVVMAQKGQPFVFDARHKVFCKGFGNVTAYFLGGCSIAPPKELMASMSIEPDLGQFFFDNPIPGFKTLMKGGAAKTGSNRDSGHDTGSSKASSVSGPRVRAEPALG